jgi:hypothetical protein
LTTNTVTGGSFGASWTGGFGATSYTYTLNGVTATPSMDKALTGQTVVFTGLNASTQYTLVVSAVNNAGSEESTVVVTTLAPPPPATAQAVTVLQNTFTTVTTPAAAANAIQAALASNVAPQTLVAAALAATPAMFTALVSSPAFQGTTVSVPSAAAATLYAAFSPAVIVDKTLPLSVNFPAVDGSVKPPTSGSNSKLAIDLNRDTFVPFSGATGYGIRVVGGVQRFVTPTGPETIVYVGDTLTFIPNGGEAVSFKVADLDIVLVPEAPAPPPAVICFLGSAPVLTPTGYRRIDRLSVGDVVKTPSGTAFVELIKKQSYTPGPATNPYIIPEGMFGANRKLHISPRHKVAVDGHMIEARHLGLTQDNHKNPIIYYNIQITKSQNMIVAGVEVESLQPLVRITVNREAFNYTLATQHGGVLTDEIRAKCVFLSDGRVSVPSIRR